MAKRDNQELEQKVAQARNGDRQAFGFVLGAIHPKVYALALRFRWHPQDAEDAAQEILIRIVTGLAGFRGDSGFRTWVYRIACNALLSMKKKRMELASLSWDEFAADLQSYPIENHYHPGDSVEDLRLQEEVRIGCTLAMLQCLGREQRVAYILGEILDLDHRDGAEVLGISPAAFRKRLSRARNTITSFMLNQCGFVDPDNTCRCANRVEPAIACGRMERKQQLFVGSGELPPDLVEVKHEIRKLKATRRAVAVYRSQQVNSSPERFIEELRKVFAKIADSPGYI